MPTVVKLTLKERFNFLKYLQRLPCSLKLRLVIDSVYNQVEITSEETSKYQIKIDPNTYELSSNDDTYTKEISDLPEEVRSAIKNYIKSYENREEFKNNLMVKTSLEIFNKVIG